MTWAKFDDAILDNEKIARAGLVGFAFHAAAITWCARNLTDGFIPRSRVATLFDVTGLVTGYLSVTPAASGAVVDQFAEAASELRPPTADSIGDFLVACGLWKFDAERDGYWLKDYLDYNPSREKVLAERARKAGNKASSRGKSAASPPPNVTTEVTAPVTGDTRPRHHGPVPVPVPLQNKILPAAAAQRPDRSPRAQGPSPEAAAAADRVLTELLEEPASGTHRAAQRKPPLTIPAPAAVLKAPRNLDEALMLPVCERAQCVIRGHVGAEWVEPEQWPEVLAVAKALAEAEGREPRPRARYHADSGVRAVVELYAAGYMPGDLVRAARALPKQAWWREGDRKRGLSTLSVEVVDRALNDGPDVGAAALLARADAELAKATRGKPDDAPTQLGSLVGRLAGGAQ